MGIARDEAKQHLMEIQLMGIPVKPIGIPN
jgi:hypothetical protein